MRRPLRYQILLPMAGIMLLSVLIVAALGAYLAVRATEQRIANQISSVVQILEDSNFPLTNSVLRQMQALSGAEYILVGGDGQVLATSGSAKRFIQSIPTNRSPVRQEVSIGDRVWVRDQGYLHATVPVAERRGAGRNASLHLFYPEADYRREWQQAMYPSLAFALLALPIVMLIASVTARHIAARMTRLQTQVEQIASGDFQQLALPDRDDEIRALSQSVNQMAAMLTEYEAEVRRTERMRTLAMLGGGIAHQLRNLATGCNLALDLHSDECSTGDDCESLHIAKRQLRLMEEYLQRFLQPGNPSRESSAELIALPQLIEDLLPLVRPTANHAGIELTWVDKLESGENSVSGNAQLLSMLVINLLSNAIEAASKSSVQSHAAGRVIVELSRQPSKAFALTVSDSGPGPSAEIRDQIFEPFVTGSPDGVGLGLAVARDVVVRHGGTIQWKRAGGMTQFRVELPCHQPELQRA